MNEPKRPLSPENSGAKKRVRVEVHRAQPEEVVEEECIFEEEEVEEVQVSETDHVYEIYYEDEEGNRIYPDKPPNTRLQPVSSSPLVSVNQHNSLLPKLQLMNKPIYTCRSTPVVSYSTQMTTTLASFGDSGYQPHSSTINLNQPAHTNLTPQPGHAFSQPVPAFQQPGTSSVSMPSQLGFSTYSIFNQPAPAPFPMTSQPGSGAFDQGYAPTFSSHSMPGYHQMHTTSVNNIPAYNVPGSNPPQPPTGPQNSDQITAAQLLPEIDHNRFNQLYFTQVPKAVVPPKRIAKILPKMTAPSWLVDMGDVEYVGEDKWSLELPDCLVAHVAGSMSSNNQEFLVTSSSDLLEEYFKLANNPLPPAPRWGNQIPSLRTFYSSLKFQLRSLSLAWAHAKLTYPTKWEDTNFIEHVILPSIKSIISSISDTIEFGREAILPHDLPYSLKKEFVSTPKFPLFPTNPLLIAKIGRFFRAFKNKDLYRRAAAYRGRARGRRARGRGRGSRGSYFRGYGNQRGSSFRGNLRFATRGQRTRFFRRPRRSPGAVTTHTTQPSNL